MALSPIGAGTTTCRRTNCRTAYVIPVEATEQDWNEAEASSINAAYDLQRPKLATPPHRGWPFF